MLLKDVDPGSIVRLYDGKVGIVGEDHYPMTNHICVWTEDNERRLYHEDRSTKVLEGNWLKLIKGQ